MAPIALYPDELVAQVLAASTRPDQVVEADRWMQQHPGLPTDQLAKQVDQQPWDQSVKALTQFPSVLANLDKNLSWTSQLGNAYAKQPQAVFDAVQVMRKRAQSAGNLKSTPQQTVTTQGQTIVIEPANPQVVYVPAYDPWLIYGAPLAVYPGWVPVEGVFVGRPGISFGIGFGIGYFGGFGWGWDHWHADWHERRVFHDGRIFESHHERFDHHVDMHRGFDGFHRGPRVHAGFHGFHGGGFHGGGFHGGGGHHR